MSKQQFDIKIANIAEGPLDPEKDMCFPNRNCDLMYMPYGKVVNCNNDKPNKKIELEWYNPYARKLLNYFLDTFSQEPSLINLDLGGQAIWNNLKIETFNDGTYYFDKVIIKDKPLEGNYLQFYSNTLTIKKKISLNKFQKYIIHNFYDNVDYNNNILSISHVNIYKCILVYNLLINLKINKDYSHYNSNIEKLRRKYIELTKNQTKINNPWCENFIINHGPVFDDNIGDIVTHPNISNKPDEAVEPASNKYLYNINFMPWQVHDREKL